MVTVALGKDDSFLLKAIAMSEVEPFHRSKQQKKKEKGN